MQNDDGGWGAFDTDCDNEVLTYIPFADHNAMIDPSSEDITGRALEAFHSIGVSAGTTRPCGAPSPSSTQSRTPDGTWYGRWGCNYLYGTWLALRGLAARRRGPARSRASGRRRTGSSRSQNADGGWGELPHSYDEPSTKGIGPSTPSQTAWALIALFATGDRGSDGGASRASTTSSRTSSTTAPGRTTTGPATGFPKVFYLRYHLYATYFPLRALALYTRESEPKNRFKTTPARRPSAPPSTE